MAKQALIVLAVIVVFGIAVPRYRGLDFVDPVIIVVYACLSIPFIVPASAELATAPAEGMLSRIGMILVYGWGTSMLMLASSIVTVNVSNWNGQMRVPPAVLLIAAAFMGLTASVAVIAGTALLARRLGANGAKTALRTVFLALLLLCAFGFRFLPQEWRSAVSRQLTTEGLEYFAWIASAFCATAAATMLPRLVRGRSQGG